MPLGIVLAVILIHVINLRAFAWTMGFEMDPRELDESETAVQTPMVRSVGVVSLGISR